MSSSISFHPFISHFPIALFVAGICLLGLAYIRDDARKAAAACINVAMGFLTAVLAVFSGLLSSDLGMRSTVEVQSHQGFSFAFVVLYAFCTAYAYIKAFSGAAIIFYGLNFLALCASAYSGYALAFH